MDIRYFEYLREINKCKSFKKAEKRLHISAQQLGRIVTSIEDEFGVSIFERTNLGLHLTKEGEEFLTRVKALLDLYQAMHRMPADSKNISFFFQGNSLQELNRIFHLISFIFPICIHIGIGHYFLSIFSNIKRCSNYIYE